MFIHYAPLHATVRNPPLHNSRRLQNENDPGKKSGGSRRLSARDVPEDKALWFCRAAVSKSLWVACWTNDKAIRLVTVFGKWEEIEDLYA
jgi:hypothetical protein